MIARSCARVCMSARACECVYVSVCARACVCAFVQVCVLVLVGAVTELGSMGLYTPNRFLV